MSKKVGGIHIAIGLSTNAFSQGISKVGTMLSSTFSGIQSIFSNITAVAGPLAIAGTAVGSAFLGWGVKTAIELESAETSFATMLKSTEKAHKLMTDLQKEAAATPFETTELVAASKTLLSFQVPLENIMGTLSGLGDISAATGKPLNELALIFGQVKSAGRLMGQDFLQLASAGVPLISALAKEFKINEDQVKALIESGAVGFPRFASAMQSIVSGGGLFENAMGKQAGTLGGLFSSLVDSAKGFATKIATMFLEAFNIKSKTQGLTQWLDSLTEKSSGLRYYIEAIARAFDTVGTVGAAVFTKVMEFVDPIWQGFASVDLSAENVRQTVLSVMETIGIGIATVWAYVRDGAKAMWEISEPILQAFVAGMLEIIDVVRQLAGYLDAIPSFFRKLWNALDFLEEDPNKAGWRDPSDGKRVDRESERAAEWGKIGDRAKEVFTRVWGDIASGAGPEITGVKNFFRGLRGPEQIVPAIAVPKPTKAKIDGSMGVPIVDNEPLKGTGAFSAYSNEAYSILANAENKTQNQTQILTDIREAVKNSAEYLRKLKTVPMLRAEL